MYILVGDDHSLVREGMCRLLKTLAKNVSFKEAGSFGELLAHTASEGPFDLILMDLQMPGWPGFSGIKNVKEHAKNTPVMVVSASENQEDIRRAMEAGAAGYIPKSSQVNVMLSAINLVFSGGLYIPAIAFKGKKEDSPVTLPLFSANAAENVSLLTPRQQDVLRCLKVGKSNKQIAYELGLSEGTVKIHVTAILKNLGARNRTQAVVMSNNKDSRDSDTRSSGTA